MPDDKRSPTSPRWWRTLEERARPDAAAARHGDEFAGELPVGAGDRDGDAGSRRDFFKVMGLSATAAMAACQRAPEQKILPFTHKPDEITPGLGLWYATACGGCAAGCGLLVKARDGRPIKVEGNPQHPVSGGAVCAVGQASVLGLYDADRARGPRVGGKPAGWKDVDAAVAEALGRASSGGRAIRAVVPWGLGPTEEAALDLFLKGHPGARVVRFDPMGQRDAIATAHDALYGARMIPDFRLDEADLVVGVEADFLGAFLAPAPLTRQWSAGRARLPGASSSLLPRAMLRHVQIEANLSLTGGAADDRIPLAPSALVPTLVRLVGALVPAGAPAAAGVARSILAAIDQGAVAAGPGLAPEVAARIDALARELGLAGPRGVLICGSDDPAAQVLAAVANALLGNAGSTAVLDRAQATRPGELALADLVAELDAGQVGAVLFFGTNPALVDRRLAAALPRAAFALSTSDRLDETAALATVHAPASHALESWTDRRPRAGVETMGQPCVAPLFDTRAQIASILGWAGAAGAGTAAGAMAWAGAAWAGAVGEGAAGPPAATTTAPIDDYAFLQARWRREVLADGAQATWDAAVRDGLARTSTARTAPSLAATPEGAIALVGGARGGARAVDGLELVLHASVGLHDGAGATANNAWLQELPDPISKVSWGNFAALAPIRAAALGISDGDVVEVATTAGTISLPALLQPGLPPSVVAIAVGHGRARAGRNAAGHGADAWPLCDVVAGRQRRAGIPVTIRRTGESRPLALTQTHASQEGRELVREASLEEFRRDPRAGNEAAHAAAAPARGRKHLGLWPGHKYEGHRWGLAIDLNKCTGCAACVVSCSAENNVPVVGEVEVRRRRELHWLRIDRYYGGDPNAPAVLHQPMMCQHCENAPCETVCPVVATVHSGEGLNQQIYNRCVGTRYCANNCPVKTRRFNWFDYDHGGELARMVLNPDVVVRSRGVMEKCSMCVHRIEEARALGRREGRALAEGDIATACQQSCPAQAITFGDANDPRSALARTRGEDRAYTILEEINVKPQVTYLTRIKNHGDDRRAAGEGGGDHHG